MSSKLQINTRVRRLIHYIEDMEKGVIQIPAFQRDFVWTKQDKLALFDSLKRGYPIGSILFWQPEKSYGESNKIGPYYITKSPTQPNIYILDGFQRLSTIFGCLTNPHKTSLKKEEEELNKEFSIFYDLEEEEFFIPRSLSAIAIHQIPLYVLIDTFEFISFANKLKDKSNFNDLFLRGQKLATTLVDYSIPSIDILGGEIDEAVEIFSRVNSKGAAITSDWILSALTYSQDKDFRLGSLIDDLIDDLSLFNFKKIKRDVIFKCITNSFGKIYFDQSGKIETLAKRSDFIPIAKKTILSIKKAVQFLFEEVLVLDLKLLPYTNQLIFITDFFNSIENPSTDQINKLKDWFWVTTYSSYFTIYSLSKQREAYNTFQDYLKNRTDDPVYNDSPNNPFSVVDFPTKINFGSVRSTALILFLLNYSNNFQSVNANDIDEVHIQYLLHNEKSPESVVPIIQNQQLDLRIIKSKDLSFWLDNITENHEKYFITKDIKNLYKEGYEGALLDYRKKMICKAEEKFVKSKGINYYNNDIHIIY